MNPEIIQDTPSLDEVMLQEAERKERADLIDASELERRIRKGIDGLDRHRPISSLERGEIYGLKTVLGMIEDLRAEQD